MHTRLQDIIRYKTGGRQTKFANLMGWTPQYLAKLVRGDTFGIRPVVAIIEKFPDIDARWFITGTGEMFSDTKLSNIRKSLHDRMSRVLEMEKYMSVMSPTELREFEQVVLGHRTVDFSPETVENWDRLLKIREEELGAKLAAAQNKSDELCNQRRVKR